MKKIGIKLSLATFFVGIFVLTGQSASAATPPDSCFDFSAGVVNQYYTNEGNNGANPACPMAVDIPSTIGGVPVTTLGNSTFSAFGGVPLTSVTIPSSVTSIGTGAFIGTSLTTLTIPDSVTSIGSQAFSLSQLTSVIIGNGVITIGDNAFANSQLSSVTLGNSVTTIGDSAFFRNQLTGSLVIPDSVVNIGSQAFATNQLTSVTIGNAVTTIDANAFYQNQLIGTLTIPDSVTTIGGGAFTANQLDRVVFGNGITSIGPNIFDYNRVARVDLPAGITSIDPEAFRYQGVVFSEFSVGDYSSVMDIIYTRVYTADASNPANLQDSPVTTFPESALGVDINGDGDQLDNLSVGGHLINPAQATITYKNSAGSMVKPTVVNTGDDLTDYVANNNDTNNLTRYFRLGSLQSLTAPAVAGYSIITPASPYVTTLAAANTTVDFVYSNATQTPQVSSSTPSAPDAGVAEHSSIPVVLILLVISGSILMSAYFYKLLRA